MTLQEKIGLTIQKLRKDRGVSQEKLALDAGVDRRYLSDVENGKRNISIEILERLAKYFDIVVSDMILQAESIDMTPKLRKDKKVLMK